MILPLLLALGHWSACVPIWTKPRYADRYYHVCSYRWIDAPQPETEQPVVKQMLVGPVSDASGRFEASFWVTYDAEKPKSTEDNIEGNLLGDLLYTAVDYLCQSGRTDELYLFEPTKNRWLHFEGDSYKQACDTIHQAMNKKEEGKHGEN